MNRQQQTEQCLPRLRFPTFSEDWEVKRWGDAFRCMPTNSLSRSDLTDEGGKIQNIHYGDIHVRYHTIFDQSKECVPFVIDESKFSNVSPECYCKAGDVIFADASEDYKDVGKAIEVVNVKDKSLLSGLHTIHARLTEKPKVLGFYGQFFVSQALRRQIQRVAQGISVLGISRSQLEKLILHVPHPNEQKKIAAFLGAVDKRLELLKAKRDALTDYKRGIMQKLFSQQMRFTNKNGTTFPAWEEKKLSELASRISKSINPKSLSSKYQLIELENIESGTGRIVGTSDPWQTKSLKLVFHKGEVIFGKLRPYLQKYAKPDFDGVCSSEFWVLNGELVSNDYLFNLIQTNKFLKLANLSSGSKMPRADWKAIKNKKFHIPARKEQKKIAAFLGAIDKCIDATAKQISKSAAYKKGLLQQMFV